MSNDFYDKAVVDAALGDLASAYSLASEIAKTARENSKNKQHATVALTLIENGFNALSHYGNPETSAALKEKMEQGKIIPEVSN